MNYMQQCVLPEECMCEVAGVRYWPGQEVKVDCEICVCERGRPQKCQPNPDCTGGSVQQKTLTESRDQLLIHIAGLDIKLPCPLSGKVMGYIILYDMIQDIANFSDKAF